jgi:hypothetical protein
MTLLYSMADCASVAGVSLPTLSRRIAAGRGPARQRVGRHFVVAEPDLLAWLAREGVRV